MTCHDSSQLLSSHELLGFGGFFLFGLFTSLHCVGMCGPLTTLFLGSNGAHQKSPFVLYSSYHMGRLIAYGTIGFLFAYLGLKIDPAGVFPWIAPVIIVSLLIYALGFKMKKATPFFKLRQQIVALAFLAPPKPRALLLGLFTPLMPCGLLYAAFAAAAAAPTPFLGAFWMAGFGLGTAPLLSSSQVALKTLLQWLEPLKKEWALRSIAIITALVISWMQYGKNL